MKNLSLLFIGLVACLTIVGCGVSEEERKKVVKENDGLKIEIARLTVENERLAKSLNTVSERLTLYRSIASSETVSITATDSLSLEEEYAKNFIDLYDIEAKYFSTYLEEKVPGLTFKIKNKGIKLIKRIKVVFYFKDAKNNTIYEESFYPLAGGFLGEKEELKPNYIWQIEQGKFFTVKKCPGEWKEGNVSFKIEEIELE